MKCKNSGSHTISYQSLLLNTIVLNDIQYNIGGEIFSEIGDIFGINSHSKIAFVV